MRAGLLVVCLSSHERNDTATISGAMSMNVHCILLEKCIEGDIIGWQADLASTGENLVVGGKRKALNSSQDVPG